MAEDLDFKSLASEMGVGDLAEQEAITSKGGFFEHVEGEYQALVGKLEIKYKDVEGKACAKDKAGATKSHAIQQLIIFKDPNGEPINVKDWTLDPNSPYGRFIYNQYVPLEADRQWQNKNMYQTFVIEGHPELDVITSEGGNFKVNLANTVFYLGMPIKFIIGKSKNSKSAFLQEPNILIHNVSKEILLKRKQVIDMLYGKLDAIKEAEKAKRDAEKANGADNLPPAEQPASADDLLGGWG